jgi:hypothetical protein
MLKEHYLNILGLSGSATMADIKRAFRKKAMLVHPDKNPNASAQKEFIQLCEAYEWLSNPTSRASKPKQSATQQPSTSKEEELEERLKRAREILRRRAVEERLKLETDFEKFKKSFIYKTAIPVYLISIFMGIVLIYDHFAPTQTITGYVTNFNSMGSELSFDIDTELGQKTFRIDVNNAYFLKMPKKTEVSFQFKKDLYEVIVLNKSIPLSKTEHDLLAYFMEHQNEVISRDTLLNQVWGYVYMGDSRVVDTTVKRLRKKLDPFEYIQTIFGVGYKTIFNSQRYFNGTHYTLWI